MNDPPSMISTHHGSVDRTTKKRLPETNQTTYPGLSNESRSNLCFLNSVIQALASITDLYLYLKNSIDHSNRLEPPNHSSLSSSSSSPSSPSVISSLIDIIQELNSPRPRRLIIRPTELIQSLISANSNSSRLFNSNQQDAHELLMMIIESVEDEVHRSIISRSTTSTGLAELIHICNDHPSPTPTPSRTPNSYPSLEKPRMIDHRLNRIPFRGLMANRIACAACGSSAGIRHSPADHLSIHLPAKPSCTIEDCLKEYTSLELLDQYVCRKCTLIEAERSIRSELEREKQQQQQKQKQKKKSSSCHHDEAIHPQDEKEQEQEEEDSRRRLRSKRRQKKILELTSHLDQLSSAIRLDPDRDLGPLLEGSMESVWSPMTTKQTMFARPPDVLTFHISRSTLLMGGAGGGILKNYCRLIFPEILILDQFTTTQTLSARAEVPISRFTTSTNTNSTTATTTSRSPFIYAYRLMSVIVHQGTHLSGHYLSFRRAPLSGSWWRISDEDVDRCDIREVLDSNPTLLIYQRLGHEDRWSL